MQISDKVKIVLQAENISAEELKMMLDRAAITRIRQFNRRYFHWLFKVAGDSLLDMQRVQIIEEGRGDTKMLEVHEECDGRGCAKCGYAGTVTRYIQDKTAPSYKPLRLSELS